MTAVVSCSSGLQDATSMYADEVTRMRNPMLYPVHVLKRLVGSMGRKRSRSSRSPLHLYACLHPSLKVSGFGNSGPLHRPFLSRL